MRNQTFIASNTYLLKGSGLPNLNIFLDETDRMRFVLLLISLQSPIQIHNIAWYLDVLRKRQRAPFGEVVLGNILKYRYIDVLAFGVGKNDYEIIVNIKKDHLPSVYMHRLLTAYGKYYNFKTNLKGHVFAGPFEAVKIGSADISKNIDLLHARHLQTQTSQSEENADVFSSMFDYTGDNRWGELLNLRKTSVATTNKKIYKNEIIRLLEKTA